MVVVAVALGSEEDVVDAICTGSAADCAAPVRAAGGKRVKNRRSRGCRLCARLIWCDVEAMVRLCVEPEVLRSPWLWYPALYRNGGFDVPPVASARSVS